jgi:argininosuccinate synthase
LRGGIYPLCAGPERLIIAEKLVEIAVNEKALTVVHGSTGAGNDQIRFDVFLKVLDPNLDILAPIRDLGINREEEIKVLQQYKIPIPSVSKSYSVNKGLLGITIGGKETKSSWESPPDNMYPGITPIENTPNTPKEIILSFQNGIPVALNRKKMEGVAVIKLLTRIGGKYGVGKNIHLGNTILGIKGRVAFAASAMTILIRAHQELEKLVLSKWQLFWKGQLGEVYGNFLHEAFYYDPVMKNIEAFIDNSQKYVTGDVKVKLNKGNIIVVGVKSPFSLMDTKVAVYGEENLLWTGQDAKGFAKVYGLSSMISSKVQRGIIQ